MAILGVTGRDLRLSLRTGEYVADDPETVDV
jgi:hypothetical protein